MEAITIKENEAFLRQKSSVVKFPDKELEKEIEILKDYCRTHSNCFAMASIQLGIPKRLILIKSSSSDMKANEENDWLVLLNPIILSQCGKTEFWEACMSCMLNFGLVERPYKMLVRYQNLNGETKTTLFEGFVCTILSHEIDHLDGIFHMDRAKKLMQIEESERMPYRTKHPYKIYSTDCEFHYSPIEIGNNINYDR